MTTRSRSTPLSAQSWSTSMMMVVVGMTTTVAALAALVLLGSSTSTTNPMISRNRRRRRRRGLSRTDEEEEEEDIMFDRDDSRRRSLLSPRAQAVERHLLTTQIPARLLGIRVAALGEEADASSASTSAVGGGDASDSPSLYLSLQMPLKYNQNVHGTGFAGSLYSLSVLSAYYLFREWMIRHDLLDDDVNDNNDMEENATAKAAKMKKQQPVEFVLVAKSGNIRYRKPVRDESIIATTALPTTKGILDGFQKSLLMNGKATITLEGHILTTTTKPGVKKNHNHHHQEEGTTSNNDDTRGTNNSNEAVIVAVEYTVELCAYDANAATTTR